VPSFAGQILSGVHNTSWHNFGTTLSTWFQTPSANSFATEGLKAYIYPITYFVLVFVFTYFYTAVTMNPTSIADELKRGNGFIPGVKPGEPTANYIDTVISRITLPGAVFLAFVAIFPSIATRMGVNSQFALFYGGTSLLILVGVVLDTLQQVESYLMMKHYDGLVKSGRIKGRNPLPTNSAAQI
jgi:preprotein translocase subunit SecY